MTHDPNETRPYPLGQALTIVVPGPPGGGWHKTGHALKQGIQEAALAGTVEIVTWPGGRGTEGLQRFIRTCRGDPAHLLVTGSVTIGAAIARGSAVSLEQTTPIGRLTVESEALGVGPASAISSLAELLDRLRNDPQSICWAIGAVGCTSHVGIGLLLREIGADPALARVRCFPDGASAVSSALDSSTDVAFSTLSEFAHHAGAGVRLLGTTGRERTPGMDLPTLGESGANVVMENSRMLCAPPSISPEEARGLSACLETIVSSKAWQAELRRHNWTGAHLSGHDVVTFVEEETRRFRDVLLQMGVMAEGARLHRGM